jgi:hypothetical protein
MVHVRRQMPAHFVGLFQARAQLLCATKNDDRVVPTVRHCARMIITTLAGAQRSQDLSVERVTHPFTI